MHLPNIRRFSVASQLTLFAVIVLMFGVFVAVNSSMQQQETRSRAYIIPTAPVAPTISYSSADRRLGGLDLGSYCYSKNLAGAIERNGIWYCSRDNSRIDLVSACQWQYKISNVTIKQEIPSNAYSWVCYTTASVFPTITPVSTSKPTPTSSPAPTPTPTVKPTSSPTPMPTAIPTIIASPTVPITIVPANTYLSFTLLLDGIGSGGDRSNPNGHGNQNPNKRERTAVVELFNDQNQSVITKSILVQYDSAKGSFTGSADFGTGIADGLYTVKVKTDQYLKATVPGIQTIKVGQVNQLALTVLITGDINGDNQMNILDYNILMNCYSDLLPPVNCDALKKGSADLTDDGQVNQYDYNLFLRELNNRGGD
jgi:hypothetical protein